MHLQQALKLMETGNPFNLEVFCKDGSIMKVRNAVSLNSYVRGGTRRLKLLDSGQIREIRDRLIISFNDEEIYI